MNIVKRFVKLLFALSIIIAFQPNQLFAMVSCPGMPVGEPQINWSWDANAASCIGLGSVPACNFSPSVIPNVAGSGSQSVPLGTQCTATITCMPGNSTKSDTLTYDNTLVWNGTICAPPPPPAKTPTPRKKKEE